MILSTHTGMFTPNVVREEPEYGRYSIYQHGPATFSVTKGGARFFAEVQDANCGSGCRCAGYIIPRDQEGRILLASAPLFKE